MTVDELRKALRPLNGKLEVMVTMTVYRGGDYFVSHIRSVTLDVGSDVDTKLDKTSRIFLNCIPDGHEEE